MSSNPRESILPDVSQFEVDFVIPRQGVDIPLGIDPFLLYKSRDATFAAMHGRILEAFNRGVAQVGRGATDSARETFTYPEVPEIGLGFSQHGKRGSGLGEYLRELIVETLVDSPLLVERSIHHIEEMQLVSAGIGADRISDISANILKHDLIEYTQAQAELWRIPVRQGVPVAHVLDPVSGEWYDGHFDLPVSPFDESAILFVPRRIVRALPWINYDDFFRHEFAAYHRARRVKGRLRRPPDSTPVKTDQAKVAVTAIARREIDRVGMC